MSFPLITFTGDNLQSFALLPRACFFARILKLKSELERKEKEIAEKEKEQEGK